MGIREIQSLDIVQRDGQAENCGQEEIERRLVPGVGEEGVKDFRHGRAPPDQREGAGQTKVNHIGEAALLVGLDEERSPDGMATT